MKISEKIAAATLFDGLPAEQLEVLAQICLDQKVEKGGLCFRRGAGRRVFTCGVGEDKNL